jgi:hypothetical protein
LRPIAGALKTLTAKKPGKNPRLGRGFFVGQKGENKMEEMSSKRKLELFGAGGGGTVLAAYIPKLKGLIAQEKKLKEEKGIPTSWDNDQDKGRCF